jgi:hypothetical protein
MSDDAYAYLLSFDSQVTIYDLSKNKQFTIPDLKMPPSFIKPVKLGLVRQALLNLLGGIAEMRFVSQVRGHCLGSLLRRLPRLLRHIGGVVLVFMFMVRQPDRTGSDSAPSDGGSSGRARADAIGAGGGISVISNDRTETFGGIDFASFVCVHIFVFGPSSFFDHSQSDGRPLLSIF